MESPQIENGCFQIARQIFDSKLWLEKPASWKIIWIYILGKVNHTDTKSMSRGSGFFNFTNECIQIGVDIKVDSIKKFLAYARNCAMISTTRSTRGTIVLVRNYNQFQSIGNYEAPPKARPKAREKHERSTTIHKNGRMKEEIYKEKIQEEVPMWLGSAGLEARAKFKELAEKRKNASPYNKQKIDREISELEQQVVKSRPVTQEATAYLESFNKLFKRDHRMFDKINSRYLERRNSFTHEQILKSLKNLSKSTFQQGENDSKWTASPEWLIENDERVDQWLNKTGKQSLSDLVDKLYEEAE